MGEWGRQADLARYLNISPAAVSESFKKHNIQIAKVDGKFDLDYAAFLLRQKQNQKQSQAQRKTDKKRISGLKNPKVKREIIRLLWPVWETAIKEIIKERAEISLETDRDISDFENILFGISSFWHAFHRIIEREVPSDSADFPFKKPPSLQWDCMSTPVFEHIHKILNRDAYYSEISSEEFERLVMRPSEPEQVDELNEPVQVDDLGSLCSGGANILPNTGENVQFAEKIEAEGFSNLMESSHEQHKIKSI
jgi:hypothetical protein